MNDGVTMVPIERTRILNPRDREKKRFELIVHSIRSLGLKQPIQVSVRSATEGDEPGYDLVCGPGRLEAFLALEHLTDTTPRPHWFQFERELRF